MNLLHTIGLMTRAEHERIVADNDEKAFAAWNKAMTARDEMRIERDGADERFKRAATDLAAQAEEIAELKQCLELKVQAGNNMFNWIEGLEAEVAALRPDAEAMRKKRSADRKRMAGKRNG